MSEKVYIGNQEHTLAQEGENAGWGEEQHDLLSEMIDTINSFYGQGDILETTTLIGNNKTDEVIPFFQFDVDVVRFSEVEYTVIRVATETVYEVGKIYILNDPTATGNVWSLNVQNMSDSTAGIDFNINSSGQIIYTTDDMAGTYIPGDSKIVFKAKSILS